MSGNRETELQNRLDEAYMKIADLTEQLRDAQQAIENYKAAAEMRWISVDERLPTPETDVLCCTDKGMPNFVAGLFDGRWESFIDGGDRTFNVTHWQPLPQPPEKKHE